MGFILEKLKALFFMKLDPFPNGLKPPGAKRYREYCYNGNSLEMAATLIVLQN